MAALAVAALGLPGRVAPRAHAAGILSQNGGGVAPIPSNVAANLVNAQQAQQVGAAAQNQLSRITAALQAMQTMQTAARNLSFTTPGTVPNGLQTGGLVPDSGLAAAGVANPVTTWVGAQTPTEVTSGGNTQVTINQTAAQALLSWDSFNVGRDTTVDFNQQGNANWVALNRISASDAPSQILGTIKASGQVYLINPNGIIFGGSSQVNVGALIASSATISDSDFLANGIYSTQTGSDYKASFTNAGGAITVQPGALISTNAPAAVTTGGGFVLLMGTQVQNGGTITTPGGQAELAAGDNFLLRPGFGTTVNPTSTTRGNEVAPKLLTQGSSLTPGGSGLVVNTGEITAATGDITLAGETVHQNGVLLSTTSVAVRGTIHLLSSASDPFSSITLGGNGYTLVEPDLTSTATELDSQRATLIVDSATVNAERFKDFNQDFDDNSLLADQQDESRIEIVSGGTVEFQNGSDTVAPGGQVAVSAAKQVQADDGATLDVSGSYAVPLAMSANDIAVNIQSFELRDDPQNRVTQVLRSNTVYVDARTLSLVPASSAAYSSGRDYTAGGLLEVSGYLANTGHTIGEYTAIGGNIDLATGTAGAIVAQSGSTFNIAGGTLNYAGGELKQSYLLGTNGHIYNVNNAPAYITYAGVYDGFTVNHPKWGVTQTYGNVLTDPSEVYQAGYTVGRAAGSLTLSSPTSIFNGAIEAGAVNGATQTNAAPAGVTDPYTLPQNTVAAPGALNIGTLNGANLFPSNSNVSFGATAPVAGGLTAPIPTDIAGTSIFNAAAINNFGLGALNVITNGSLDISAPLTLAAGGQFGLFASSVNIGANLTAAGGAVSAGQIATVDGTPTTLQLANPPAGGSATGDTVVGEGVTISTAGLWTNLALDPSITFTQAFSNGGTVNLGSVNNLTLGAGSVIDTAAGAVVAANGTEKGGAGGAISLAAATPSEAIPLPTGNLTLGGTLDAVGFTKGGALTLAAPSFMISSTAGATLGGVTLDPAFFTQGFSAYHLNSTGAITVAPGTAVNVVEPTEQFITASQLVPTGGPPEAGSVLLLNPVYTVNGALTAITQRAGASFSATIVPTTLGPSPAGLPVLAVGAGAAVSVDPGQAIALSAPGQITIDGSLIAPGGAISAVSSFNTDAALPGGPGTTSVWLGGQAVLDASARAASFTDAAGGMLSVAPSGGSITLGSTQSTAAVIIRQGAVIEASGSSATDELTASKPENSPSGKVSVQPSGKPVPVAGAGGGISLASQEGIYNDGTLTAAAGGPSAAGGTLSMAIEADQILNTTGTELTPRIFTITQADPGALLPPDLTPGAADPSLVAGTAQISAQQITAGGFGNVVLSTRDAFVFQNDVTLSAPQSISLLEGVITDSSATGAVALNAPYVLLSGQTPEVNGIDGKPLAVIGGFSAQTATGAFTVNAALIDIANRVRFGGLLPAQGATPAIDLAGFGTVNLNSGGDLRFAAPETTTAGGLTDLVTSANLNLTAREIYTMAEPGAVGVANSVKGTAALVVAGYDPVANPASGGFFPGGVLTINRAAGTTAAAPDTLGGTLTFEAATVRQAGVVWQPLGSITFGNLSQFIGNGLVGGGDPATQIEFLPGSLTSVSAAGLTLPFGGTTDGVTYDVNGVAVQSAVSATFNLPSVANGVGTGKITVAALTTDIASGAVLNLQGGGTLTGAGFISGQGGSTDVLTTPLLNIGASGVTQPTLAADPVYAIVTGPQPVQAVAYTQSGVNGSAPALGAQIVIPAGVPGLPAGTYTLLPASYALNPGGYRVEFDGAASLAAPAVTALANGSYAVAGFTALANTQVRGTLASNLTITPRATVLNYAEYDQENYSQFLVATAARIGAIRPVLPEDAGTLILNLPANSSASLTNAGLADFTPAAGGIGGTLQISGAAFSATPSFDIYGAAPVGNQPTGTVSLSAAQIDAFDPFILELGAAGQGFQADTAGVTLEKGATLKAARVVITATAGGIKLKSGSEITTLGQGTLLADSTNFGLFSNGGASVLDVGNGYLSYATTPPSFSNYGPITVQDGAKIYTDGSIAFSTSAAVNIGVNASYGGKYLDLAVPEINVGDRAAALAAQAPSGLLLTPAVLRALTRGVPGIGVPAVQIIDLTATDSLNFYGKTALDLSGANVQLVINTPAIYGYGKTGDVAKIAASTIVWDGISTINPQTSAIVSSLPGGEVTQLAGHGLGTLDFDAGTIILGSSDLDLPQHDVTLNRLTLGFSTVNLNASSEISANNQGTLAVYQSQANFGQAGTGGKLNLNAPLLTAADGATIGFTAGGVITAGPAAGETAATKLATEAAGGEIDLNGAAIKLDGSVILPSGKLNLQATGNITLGAGSLIDLAGVTTTIVDKTIYGFGGDLVMESATGDISQAVGSVINVSAANNTAGSVSLTATSTKKGRGQVALLGTLEGAASGGYASGGFDIRAQDLGDFAALNASLNAGGFFQSRSFDIKQGDLTIGNGVQAHDVTVSLDNGSLTVAGLINASGGGGGSIDLAASDNLTVASTGVLDAHGTVLQTDSYGQAIPAANAPTVSLTTTKGELTLASGAHIDLASADSTARGDLELNVPRLNGQTSGDADIEAADAVDISGAASIAVNAFWTYYGMKDPAGSVTGEPDRLITQAYLAHINTADTLPFMQNAATNTDLASRLAGLKSYGAAFHFRPGVQIVSNKPNGDLTVQGDIDLAGYRYGPGVIPGDYGSGEPGVLLIRAGGNLNIYGSITDGFEKPISDKGTEFAKGWVLYADGEPYGQSQTLPTAVTIAKGSAFASGTPVNFAVPITGGTFQAGAVAPVALTVQGQQVTSVAFIATSAITSAGGKTLFAQGAVVPAGSIIPNHAVIAAGGTLPFAVDVGPVTWPANTPFTVTTSFDIGGGNSDTGVVLAEKLPLLAGSFIPAGSSLKFVKGEAGVTIPTDPNGHRLYFPDGTPVPETIDTRTATGGTQGQLYGLAKLLAAGDMSWSIGLVAGADTAAASASVVRSSSALAAAHVAGDVTLADTHYGQTTDLTMIPARHNPDNPKNAKICARDPASCKPTYAVNYVSVVPAFSVVRTGTGSLTLAAGGSINEGSSFGIYTAGAQSAAILNGHGNNPYNLAQGFGTATSLLGSKNADLAALVANYRANYPTGGGNVVVSAQGNLNGFISTASSPVNADFASLNVIDTDAEGAWLWRQGGAGQPGAWWVEYGSLNALRSGTQNGHAIDVAEYSGFQGIGTIGGGNLTVNVGENAGGLDLVVASNGRVKADGTLVQNGGGNMSVKIGGALNFDSPGSIQNFSDDAGGLLSDLRGNTSLSVGSVGSILPVFGLLNGNNDPRFLPPFTSESAEISDGIDLLPGDGAVTVDARGDLVINGAGNPGAVLNMTNTTPVDFVDGNKRVKKNSGGTTDFSLWSATTAINLFSAGGDTTPPEQQNLEIAFPQNQGGDPQNAGTNPYIPPNLSVISQNGNIDFGDQTVELAPSPSGQLQLLAADSILGQGNTIGLSGAALATVSTPFNPGVFVSAINGGLNLYTNIATNVTGPLIDFGTDVPTTALHAADTQPALVYAGSGDILNIEFGQFIPVSATLPQQVIAAKPFDIVAGRDIVDSGTIASPDTFLNINSNDITSVTAGRDIIESSFDIAGPGNLVVQAGRDVYLVGQLGANIPPADQGGAIESLGPLFDINPNDRNSGAGVSVLAGAGAGPDYAGFANQYLNPASTLNLSDVSQIVAANDATLYAWLQKSYGYTGSAADAYAYFLTLAPGPQELFLRQLYFATLNTSGLEFNDPSSPHYKSYILGQDAIAALFPAQSASGQPITYAGDITLSGGSGIHTDFGGTIQTLTPGGQTIIGVEGASPPASAGLITQGSGDIDIYSQSNVLLGESRVLTTFGGNVLIWSTNGNINAGRGSKTSIDYTPLQRVYDNYGDVFLSPTVPSSGAGIATLNPIPGIPPGNINLVAPLGTVDAGEAGIRVSGNLNIAAAHVLNTSNIQVQGTSAGVPAATAPDVSGLTSASNTAGASAQAAEDTTGKNQAAPLPSIWIVEILGYGGDGGQPVTQKRKTQRSEKI